MKSYERKRAVFLIFVKGRFGNIDYFSIFITSDFRKNAKEFLRKILLEKVGVEVVSVASTGATNYNTIILEMRYQGKTKIY